MSRTEMPRRTRRHHTTVGAQHIGRDRLKSLRATARKRRPEQLTAAGVVRRLEALYAMGWPEDRICAALDITTPADADQHRDGLHTLADDWGLQLGPCRDTLTWARARDMRTILAWDRIDDPTEHPVVGPTDDPVHADDVDDIAVDRLLAGQLSARKVSTRERRTAIDLLRTRGLLPGDIADRVGMDQRDVSRDLSRMGRSGLTDAEQSLAQSRGRRTGHTGAVA